MTSFLTAKECRAKALDCRHRAKHTNVPLLRQMFEEVADQWDLLAEQKEREEPKGQNVPPQSK